MHLPGHVRDTFAELVEQIEESGSVPDAVTCSSRNRGKTETTRQFLARFVGCMDVVPGPLRAAVQELFFRTFGADLSDELVGTYARAARRVDELRRGTADLVL